MKKLIIPAIIVFIFFSACINRGGVKTAKNTVPIAENTDSIRALEFIARVLKHPDLHSYIQRKKGIAPYTIDISLSNLPYKFTKVNLDSITTLRFMPEDSLKKEGACHSILFGNVKMDSDSVFLSYSFGRALVYRIEYTFRINEGKEELVDSISALVNKIRFLPPGMDSVTIANANRWYVKHSWRFDCE